MASQSASAGSSPVGKALACQTARSNDKEMRLKKASQLQALITETSCMNEAANAKHFQSISAKEADLFKKDPNFQLLIHLLSKIL
jgi:hypothetical protein